MLKKASGICTVNVTWLPKRISITVDLFLLLLRASKPMDYVHERWDTRALYVLSRIGAILRYTFEQITRFKIVQHLFVTCYMPDILFCSFYNWFMHAASHEFIAMNSTYISIVCVTGIT